MKKLFILALAAFALMASVSCSKDEKDKVDRAALVGTSWQCVHTFTIPIVGTSATLQIDLDFVTEKSCHGVITLPSTLADMLPMDPSGDFEYTFNGKQVVIKTGSDMIGDIAMDYANETLLILTVPERYRSLLGTSELIFHKK